MNKLLSACFARLKKDKCFWFCILFMVFMAVYIVLDSYFLIIKYNASVTLESLFFTYTMLAATVFPVFCSLFLGTEFSDGTVRNKLIIGHTRVNVYLSSLICCIITGLLICMAYILPILGIGIPILGCFVTDIRTIVVLIGCSFVLFIAFAAIHTLIAMLNQNRAVTAVICIMSVFLMIMVGAYLKSRLNEPETWGPYIYVSESGELSQEPEQPNPYYVSGIKRNVYEFLCEFLPGGQAASLSYMSVAHPGRMTLYSILITVTATGFGIYGFQKKDIK